MYKLTVIGCIIRILEQQDKIKEGHHSAYISVYFHSEPNYNKKLTMDQLEGKTTGRWETNP